MNFLYLIYDQVLYRPLTNALVFLTSFIPGHDAGIAVILLTLLVRVILFPVTHRSIITQHKLRELEPEISKIKKETASKREEQARRMMELYREHGVSPFMGCVTLLIQLPILIALYHVFLKGILFDPAILYSFITSPEFVNMKFLGLIELTEVSYVLAFLAGASQFFQMKLAFPVIPKKGESFGEEMSRAMAIQSVYVFPILIFFISLRFPAALSLYWTVTNVFATVHESLVRYRAKKRYGGSGKTN